MTASSAFSPFRAAVLAAGALGAVLATDPASAAGPFRPFLGSWRGTGEILGNDGRHEPISCRATYEAGDGDASLAQSLVCASDSFRLNIQTSATAEDGELRGQWRETTRNVEGNLSGQIGRGDFEGVVNGSGFTAQISLRASGKKQAVRIVPSAGDIRAVVITLTRTK